MCLFKKAVLVVHGFGGATWENEYLVNYLKLYTDFEVFDFTLPGHTLEIIKGVKYQEWLNASEEMLLKILKKYPTVYLVGHSMGGVIASYLASKNGRVKKLVLLAPAFEYINMERNREDVKNVVMNGEKLQDNQESLYDEAFLKLIQLPIPTIMEFARLVKECKTSIELVKCKTLILHGMIDELVPVSSSEYAYEHCGAKEKQLTKIEGVRHRILISAKSEKVSEYVRKFLRGGIEWELGKKSQI